MGRGILDSGDLNLIIEATRHVGGKVEGCDIHTNVTYESCGINLLVLAVLLYVKVEDNVVINAGLNEHVKSAFMTEVGSAGVVNVGDLNLALPLLKVVVKVDSIKLNTSGNKPSYRPGSIAVSGGGETVCNKDNSLDLILTEEGCGEIKGGGNVCTAVVNGSLLNAFYLGA